MRTVRLHRALSTTTWCLLLAACVQTRAAVENGTSLDELLGRHAVRPLAGADHSNELQRDFDGELVFLAAGHLYGAGSSRRILPAASFVDNIDRLRAEEPSFFVSLGDFIRGARKKAHLDAALHFFDRLDTAVYNAVGNHDMAGEGRRKYEERFGPTFGGFRIGSSLFLVLDTELDPWNVRGEQLEFLAQCLERGARERIQNVFVFAHRVVFAAEDERYAVLFEHCNSRRRWPGTNNYAEEVLPLLEAFARNGDVYWFAGDVGVRWSYGLFYDHDERHGVHYIATGLGETPTDNVVRVTVTAGGDVELERIALTSEPLPPLEECGPELWRAHFGEDDVTR